MSLCIARVLIKWRKMKVLIIIMVACKENNQMKYWLLKSEPEVWSIDQQINAGSKRSELGWCQKLSKHVII